MPQGWYVYADGFEYDMRGRVLDRVAVAKSLSLYDICFEYEKPKPKMPTIKLPSEIALWICSISFGDNRSDVIRKSSSLPKPKNKNNLVTWSMKGNYKVKSASNVCYKNWNADTFFTKGSLVKLVVIADPTYCVK